MCIRDRHKAVIVKILLNISMLAFKNISWPSLAGFNLLHSSIWIIPDLENKHSEGIKIQLRII